VTTPSPTLGASATTGWHKAAVQVTLNWVDVSSGVAPTLGTSYRLNDGNLTVYSVPFTVSTEGSTKLTFRSIDRALNAEATQTAYVNIDETSPTVSAATVPSRGTGWYNQDVVATLTGSDSLSGVQKTQYRLTGEAVWTDTVANQFTSPASPNGTKKYDYQAVDNAGNVSSLGSLTLKMDTVKPKASGSVPETVKTGSQVSLGYRANDATPKCSFTLKIKYKSSGKVARTYSIGSKSSNKTYTYKVKPNLAKGTYQYWVYATDQAGNKTQKLIDTFKVK
jgi:hypothetical protein